MTKKLLILTGLVLALTHKGTASDSELAWYCDAESGAIRWTETGLGPQKAAVVLPAEEQTVERLVIFLHGDSPRRNPTYQYRMAKAIADQWPGTVAAGLLRPGYADGCGTGSGGVKGNMMGDNYTPEVVASLASTIKALKAEFSPERTVVMGHSGGAALTGLLAARFGDLQDQSVMISCPCDLPKWRDVMVKLTDNPRWKTDMPGLSATAEVPSIPSGLDMRLFVGSDDRVTPPFLSEDFVAAAKARGMDLPLTIVPGAKHDFIIEAGHLEAVIKAIQP